MTDYIRIPDDMPDDVEDLLFQANAIDIVEGDIAHLTVKNEQADPPETLTPEMLYDAFRRYLNTPYPPREQ